MGTVTLAKANIVCLKQAIRQKYPEIKSSHLSEAIAFALGFRTHAPLLAAMDSEPPGQSGRVWLDGNRLTQRLHQLSYDSISARELFAAIDKIKFPVRFDSQAREAIRRISQNLRASVHNANDN